METFITIKHISICIQSSFETFTNKLEFVLGRLENSVFDKLETAPDYVEDKIIHQMEGAEELILFQIYDHGRLLNIAGQRRKAKQYLIGNPRIASLMSRHHIGAALYAPLRALVFEKDDKTTQIEYDLPSSLFGQFKNSEVNQVAITLDQKMEKLFQDVKG